MQTKISKLFHEVLINSLSTPQVNFLGELYDPTYNLHKAAGLSQSIPIPRQNAAEVLMRSFPDDADIVRLFSILLQYEGKHFCNRDLILWGRDDFIRLLEINKWIYDNDLKRFFIDPFYEHAINFLKDVKVIDLTERFRVSELIRKFETVSRKMSIKDIDWRITLRLYDLDPKSAELTRKIIDLLLARQNLQNLTADLFFCLKELTINASKANYKVLFKRHIARKEGTDPDLNYAEFLEKFRQEIEDHGNKNLLKMAKVHDRYITIAFQSSHDAIEMWVVNNQNISAVEKKKMLKVLSPEVTDNDSFADDSVDLSEGAGLGLPIILNMLRKYSRDPEPLKVVFYPEFIKVGFEVKRADLARAIEEKKAAAAAAAGSADSSKN